MKKKFKDWVVDVSFRTIKTMAQAAIGVIGGSALMQDVNWMVVGSTVALAGISCILFNIANLEIKDSKED